MAYLRLNHHGFFAASPDGAISREIVPWSGGCEGAGPGGTPTPGMARSDQDDGA